MLKAFVNSPRLVCCLVFILINVGCGVAMYTHTNLLGDVASIPLQSQESVIYMTIAVVASYVVLLGIVFPAFSRLRIRRSFKASQPHPKAFGITLFLLQAAFIAYFMVTGTFVAGSTERMGTALSAFWVIVSVDSLFFIYYGFYRESKLFWPNAIIALLSNFLRGWSGVFLLIAFMEFARMARQRRIKTSVAALALAGVIVAYPVVYVAKLQIRNGASSAAVGNSFFDGLLGAFNGDEYAELVENSAAQVPVRLQLVANSLFVWQNRDALADAVSGDQVKPFWAEGIYGIAVSRLTQWEPVPDLGTAFANLIDPTNVTVSWNSNPGFLSWLMLMPLATPLYFIYTCGLMLLCIVLVKRMGGNRMSMDMLWFATLSYLLPGWIASYLLFFNSLILFYGFHWFYDIFSLRKRRDTVTPLNGAEGATLANVASMSGPGEPS